MRPTFNLENHCVLVTGAASGIGLSTVKAFLASGATVAVNDLPGDKLDSVVQDLAHAGNVIAAPGDVSDTDSVNAMVEMCVSKLGKLDCLVNNAGTPATKTPIAPEDFDKQSDDFWERLLNVNLLGPYRCTRAASVALRATSGSIVNTASVSAYGGGGSSSPYCATKAGLVALTREWSRALAPQVRVNAIAPGIVDSDWMCRFENTDFDVASEIPLGRSGSTDEYASSILFLAVGATYMTGQTMIIDGGMMA